MSLSMSSPISRSPPLADQVGKDRVGDLLSPDTEALVEAVQMGRGVQADPIARLGQDSQSAVHRYGEILEFAAEIFDVEFAHAIQPVTHCHLIIVLEMFVNVSDIFFLRKGVGDAFVQCSLVRLGI